MKEKLIEMAKAINIDISIQQAEQFAIYMRLLLEWNQKINLTAIVQEDEIISKHFVDSLTCARHIKKGIKIADVGTGAGFPGLPLKILFGDWIEVVLMDSLNKRISFLNAVIQELKLKNISAIHIRAEDAGQEKQHREKYQLVVSRAVANLSTLSEYCIPLAEEGGSFISMKGPNPAREIEEAERAIRLLGGEVRQVQEIVLPKADAVHSLIHIYKERKTPKEYPRTQAKIKNQPL